MRREPVDWVDTAVASFRVASSRIVSECCRSCEADRDSMCVFGCRTWLCEHNREDGRSSSLLEAQDSIRWTRSKRRTAFRTRPRRWHGIMATSAIDCVMERVLVKVGVRLRAGFLVAAEGRLQCTTNSAAMVLELRRSGIRTRIGKNPEEMIVDVRRSSPSIVGMVGGTLFDHRRRDTIDAEESGTIGFTVLLNCTPPH